LLVMKRDNGDMDDGPSNKYQRSDSASCCLRVLIPSRAAGPIIGKAGETIKKLRSEHSVRLHIPDSRGPERIFYLEGEIPNICGCLKDLIPRFLEVLNAKNAEPRLLNSREDEDSKEIDPEKLLDIRILIHQSQVGSVIGKKGERIKELKMDHNMKIIKIYQELAPGSTDRVVQLIGEPEDACDCAKGIMETLETSPIRGPRNDYDANFSASDSSASAAPQRSSRTYDAEPYSAPYSRDDGYQRRGPPQRSGYRDDYYN